MVLQSSATTRSSVHESGIAIPGAVYNMVCTGIQFVKYSSVYVHGSGGGGCVGVLVVRCVVLHEVLGLGLPHTLHVAHLHK